MIEKNSELVSEVVRDFEKAKRRREPYEEVWTQCYKLYNSYLTPLPKDDWHSNIFISKCFSIVETELPRIVMATVASRDFFGTLPVTEEETDRAKLIKDLITFQVNDEMDIFLKWVDYIKQFIIYGNSPAKVYWKRLEEERTVKVSEEIKRFFSAFRKGKSFLDREIKKPIKVYDGPQLDLVDLWDFFPALPTVSTVEDQPYIIQRSYRNLAYLERVQKDAGYDEEVIAFLKEREKDETESGGGGTEDAGMKRLQERDISISDMDSGRYEIIERWDEKRRVTTIINDLNLFLRDIDNPYERIKYPYIFTKHTPLPGEFYGKGIIEPNISAQFLLNDIVNERMDNVRLLIGKIFTWIQDSETDPEGIVTGPLSVIPVEKHEDLQERVITDVTANAYTEQAVISEVIQENSAVWPYTQGKAPARKETASGIISLQQASEIRFQLISMMYQHSGIKQLVKMVHSLNRQFLTEEKKIRILGRKGLKFTTIKRDDINIDCDFVVVGHPTMGDKREFLNRMLLVAQYLGGRGDQYEVDRMVLEAAEVPNIDDIIGPSPEDRLDPMEENKILATGEFINAHRYDQHDHHIPMHTQLLQSPELNPDFLMVVANHLRQHKIFFDFAMQQRQQQTAAQGGSMLGGIPTPTGEGGVMRPMGQAETGERPAPTEEIVRRNMQ